MQTKLNISQSRVNEGKVTLKTKSLSKIYRTGEIEVHALKHVDILFYESELVVLLGASGSGKSTSDRLRQPNPPHQSSNPLSRLN